MALALCPFCASGLPWNSCGCHWAVQAQRHGLIRARQWYAASGGKERKGVVPVADDARIEARPPSLGAGADRGAVVEDVDREVVKERIGGLRAVVDRVAMYAPLGECEHCDRRRAEAREAVRRSRAKRKGL